MKILSFGSLNIEYVYKVPQDVYKRQLPALPERVAIEEVVAFPEEVEIFHSPFLASNP